MNVLDSTVTRVDAPVWDEQYQVYRVTLEYDCWGGTNLRQSSGIKMKPQL